MKYFLDTEFIEGSQKKIFFKSKPTIDLISIGMVDENGREFYAISKEFNLKEAWNRWQQRTGEGDINHIEPRLYWIRENVLHPIYKELHSKENLQARQAFQRCNIIVDESKYEFTYSEFKRLINKYGKTNKQIAAEIKTFVGTRISIGNWDIEFYAYYADYDWVVFCWLFGTMMNLPEGFPKYCRDLKQIFDQYVERNLGRWRDVDMNLDWEAYVKQCEGYPKQKNEHNALADAKWNLKLFEFLTKENAL